MSLQGQMCQRGGLHLLYLCCCGEAEDARNIPIYHFELNHLLYVQGIIAFLQVCSL